MQSSQVVGERSGAVQRTVQLEIEEIPKQTQGITEQVKTLKAMGHEETQMERIPLRAKRAVEEAEATGVMGCSPLPQRQRKEKSIRGESRHTQSHFVEVAEREKMHRQRQGGRESNQTC